MSDKTKKPELEEFGLLVTGGVTADGKYSLAIKKFGGQYCLCVFKCECRGGLHYTGFSKKELVTAIPPERLEYAATKCAELNGTRENGK